MQQRPGRSLRIAAVEERRQLAAAEIVGQCLQSLEPS